MPVFIPSGYVPTLVPDMMEQALAFLKYDFQEKLAAALNLRRVTAPLFVLSGTGLNDDLSGTERAVNFPIKAMNDARAEVVHSLAKWKRMKLGEYHLPPGYGLYTDMNAIRADEDLDNIHSLYVDQWDWEQTITAEDRSLDFLRTTVEKIYGAMLAVEKDVYDRYPHILPWLPEKITFLQSEDLMRMSPGLTPKERENEAAKKYGAIFIIGIGAALSDGEKHDGRAPDYDDWSTETSPGYFGLNGDILLWNPILEQAFEVSSMGVRVDKDALLRQLEIGNCLQRKSLFFHDSLLKDKIPLSVGGGIGQSRLCMFYLRCAHIGEVQASIWPPAQVKQCAKGGIILR